jgi:hypothetical protein
MIHTIATTAVLVVVSCVALYVLYSYAFLPPDTSQTNMDNTVCMTKEAYDRLSASPKVVYKEKIVHVPVMEAAAAQADVVETRDRRVLYDELYPGVNRTSAGVFRDFHVHQDVFNIPTQPVNDTYRLVGYLKNDSDQQGTWKLFGRDKDRNRGEFYITPTNNYNDIKIQITDNMVVGREKLRSMDTIPDSLTFNSPLLSNSPYTFVELPKGDLKDLRYL